jgi:hypothetical protein
MASSIETTSTTTTLKNNGNTYMSVDTNDVVTMNQASLNGGQLGGRRNIVINGEMKVAQRSTSETGLGAAAGYFTLDRYRISPTATAGRLTMAQVADGPAGFANCLKFTTTTADTSIAATEKLFLQQKFEGQDLQQLQKGTATAKQFTVSFYVKGNAAATYSVELKDADNNRNITQSFAVTTSWNRIELTFAADTTGALNDDNAESLAINIWLHGGSNFTSGTYASNTWASTTDANRYAVADRTSIFDATSRTFFITGIQMELGAVATPFEHRSYGTELALCQRYYQHYGAHANTMLGSGNTNNATTVHRWGFELPVVMRAAPTGALSGTCGLWNGGAIGANAALGASYCKPEMIQYDVTCDSALTNTLGLRAALFLNTGTFTASAEL